MQYARVNCKIFDFFYFELNIWAALSLVAYQSLALFVEWVEGWYNAGRNMGHNQRLACGNSLPHLLTALKHSSNHSQAASCVAAA